MIKRSHIRHFLALVDTGSFTQAARRVRVTQPTLSTGIADLERMVGVRLFERHRKGVRLTDGGGAFLPLARDLENRFREADSFGLGRPPPARLVRTGIIRTLASTQLQAFVRQLGRSFEIDLIEGSDYDLRTGLAAGRLDLALTVLRAGENGRLAWPAFEEPYVMLADSRHRLVGRSRVQPSELATETMIARRACEALSATSRFFTRNGVRPRFALKSDNDERCLKLAAAGLGMTSAPLSLASEDLRPIDVLGYDLRRIVGMLVSEPLAGDAALRGHFDAWAGRSEALPD